MQLYCRRPPHMHSLALPNWFGFWFHPMQRKSKKHCFSPCMLALASVILQFTVTNYNFLSTVHTALTLVLYALHTCATLDENWHARTVAVSVQEEMKVRSFRFSSDFHTFCKCLNSLISKNLIPEFFYRNTCI